MTAPDGIAALDIVEHKGFRPDLILADYNLPGGMDGLAAAGALRNRLHRQIPIIILTGDISTSVLQTIALHDCVQLNKPVKSAELIQVARHLLAHSVSAAPEQALAPPANDTIEDGQLPVIFVVDDNKGVRELLREVLEDNGWAVEDFESCEGFLEAYRPGRDGCLLLDAYLPGMNGLDLLQRLKESGAHLPVIMITGAADVTMAVESHEGRSVGFHREAD